MAANQPIPLPTGLSGLEASPRTKEVVKNLFYTNGKNPVLSIRPGVDKIKTGFGKCRGMGKFKSDTDDGELELYSVSGTRLIRITVTNPQARKVLTDSDVTIDDLGEITGDGEVIIVGGFTRLMILEVGGLGYSYSHGGGLVQITDVNFQPSDSVSYDNGRFICVPTNGEPFFWSALDDPETWPPGSFADAELNADPNRVGYVLKSSLYIMGSESTQRFRYDSTRDTYLTYQGEESQVGYVGGLAKFGESFAFLGNSSEGDFNIYIMDGQPRSIISDYVSELINNEYSLPELKNIVGESIEWKSTPMLMFRLPRHTLIYYGDWALWHSGVVGKAEATWRINHLEDAYGFTWTGDFNGNSIGVLRDSGNEYGADIEWFIRTYVNATPEANYLIKRVTCQATMGKASGDTVPRISLAVSKDGRLFGPPLYKALGTTGQYNQQLRWGAPVIKGYDSVSMEFSGYGNVVMNLDGVYFE